ncbi:hypothetical protein [Streptomyces lushanensis]|nr:hypothetical protein [Streptomyces lushanensis]
MKTVGARRVAVVVLGRYLNPSHRDIGEVERARLRRFSWDVYPLRNWSHS